MAATVQKGVALKFPSQESEASPDSLRLFEVGGVGLLRQGGQSLVTLGVAADKAADAVSLGGLVEFASNRVNVSHIDLHGAEIIGGQDAVGPRAVITRR